MSYTVQYSFPLWLIVPVVAVFGFQYGDVHYAGFAFEFTMVTWILFVVLVLVLVLFGIFMYQYRLKGKSEEQLRATNADLQQQQDIINRQAQDIQLFNNMLVENNLQLSEANEEVRRQIVIQTEQSRLIERTNAELNEKNIQVESALSLIDIANAEIRTQMALRDDLVHEIVSANVELQEKNGQLDVALRELKEKEAQLVHSERMSTAGMLTAGVMHEINNPNAAVYSALESVQHTMSAINEFFFSLLDEAGSKSVEAHGFRTMMVKAVKMLDVALEGSERVKQIVNNLQNFTKHQRVGAQMGDIATELRSTIQIFRYQFKGIVVETAFEEHLSLSANFAEINQVFLNLMVNAAQAGATHICLEGECLPTSESASGGIVIRVRDNGTGMSDELQQNIFEPFFSAKGGDNSGLGLSISKSIIEQHGANIAVSSEVGVGTTFVLTFPFSKATDAVSSWQTSHHQYPILRK